MEKQEIKILWIWISILFQKKENSEYNVYRNQVSFMDIC